MPSPGNLILSVGERKRLFVASCIALLTTAMVFSVRAAILDDLGAQFHVNKQLVGIFVRYLRLYTAPAFWVYRPMRESIQRV